MNIDSDPNDPTTCVEDARAFRLAGRVRAGIATLEQADDAWDTLTTAQRMAALRVAVRVVAKLARLVLGRVESE